MFDVRQRMSELLKSRGMTGYAFCKETGIPSSSLNNWLTDKHNPSVDNIELFCQGLGISLCEFFATSGVVALTEEYVELMRGWNLLDRQQKQAVLSLMAVFTRDGGPEPERRPKPEADPERRPKPKAEEDSSVRPSG